MEDFKLAELFLKYNYLEVKDLSKSFLTIIITVFMLSVTFSEKIVDYQKSKLKTKLLMVISWILLILSIIFCGIGLIFISIAGGQAVYGVYFYGSASLSYKFIIISGISFVLGLVFMIIPVILGFLTKHH